MTDHIERHYIGIALLCCVIGYIALSACGKAQNDGALPNLAFALAGGLAGAALPRRDGGSGNTIVNGPADTVNGAVTPADQPPA